MNDNNQSQTNTTTKLPIWFWVVSVLALLWFAMDMSAFVMRVTVTEEARLAMSERDQYLHRDFPLWVNLVFAGEVFGGLLGTLALLFKRRLAFGLLTVSLLGVLAQSSYVYFISDAVAVLGMPLALMPLVSVTIGVLMLFVVRTGRLKGWLA